MNLHGQQKLLAELFTQQKSRELYFTDADAPGKLNKKEVGTFALGLIFKRLNAVKSWLPLSFALQEKLLTDSFIEYASAHPIHGLHLKHHRDVIAFYEFVSGIVDPGHKNPYLMKVMQYEVINVKKFLPEKKCLLFISEYRFHSAAPETIRDQDKLRRKRVWLMVRLTKNMRWISWVL